MLRLRAACFFIDVIDDIHGHPEPFAYVMLSGVEASFTAQDKLRRRVEFLREMRNFSYSAELFYLQKIGNAPVKQVKIAKIFFSAILRH